MIEYYYDTYDLVADWVLYSFGNDTRGCLVPLLSGEELLRRLAELYLHRGRSVRDTGGAPAAGCV